MKDTTADLARVFLSELRDLNGRLYSDEQIAEMGDRDAMLTAEAYGMDGLFCDANTRRGTGTGFCGRALNIHGQCDQASHHVITP